MASTIKIAIVASAAAAKKAFSDISDEAKKSEKVVGAALAGIGTAGSAVLSKGFADNLDIGAANAKLAGQLGLTAAEADKAGKAAAEVYKSNWGASIEDINVTIQSVAQNLGSVGEVSQAELTKMATSAQVLADVFGADVGESAKAAGQLIKNGLAADATEAFDIIGAGFRDGADRSGDFLETLSEYSPQFSKLGFSGGQALALIEDGLKAGARDADVIADAFKEFSLRAIDGSKSTSDAYKALGLDAKQTAADIAAGGPAANVATQEVLQSLNNIKDPLKQNQVGVALFGTQWEDTLRQILPAVAELGDASDSVADSVQMIGNTAGGSAKGQIETLQRSFESWVQGMSASHGTLGLVVTGLSTFGGGALAAGADIGQLVTGLSSLNVGTKLAAAGTQVMAGAQWLLNAAMSANPITLVIIAIVALVAAIVIAYKKSETFRAIVQAVWAAIKAAVLAVVEWFKGAMATLWATAQAAWEAIKIAVRLVMFAITTYINAYKAAVLAVWNGIRDAAVSAWNAIKNAVSTVISTTRSIVSGGLDKVKALFSPSTLYNAGRELITGLVNGIGDRIGAAIEKVRAGVAKIKGLLPGSPIKWGPLTSWNNGGAGKRLMGLLEDGIRSGVPGVSAALNDGLATDASIGIAPAASTQARGAVTIGQLSVNVTGSLDLSSPAARKAAAEAMAREIQEALVAYEGGRR